MIRRTKVVIKESTGRRIIEQSRLRLWCVALFFVLCFTSISVRMMEIVLVKNPHATTVTVTDPDNDNQSEQVDLQSSTEPTLVRGDIVDRNGQLIATSLMTASVFVNPKEIKDKEEAATKISKALGLDYKQLHAGLTGGKSFFWIKRNLTPKEESVANSLGIPGLYFQPEEKRVYPYGNMFSHVVGYVGLDNKGLAGMEKQFDQRLRDTALNAKPLELSLDVRLQGIVREEMQKAVKQFNAIGATGVVMDLHSGELLSMVSLPDFDPHKPGKGPDINKFNRASLGDYEMGSTFKSFTMAMALEDGTANFKTSFDATGPLHIGNFTISDAHSLHRWLTVPEIYAFSSNVGTARMIMQIGIKRQKEFLEKMGMTKPIDIELPEKSAPLYPADWKEINSITIAYGHGISVSPLHLVRGIATLVNGGTLERLTLLKDGNKERAHGARVISEQTSENIRRLMRMVVDHGTGTKADVEGYRVAGKTGTAEKATGGGYNKDAKLASFIATFPVDDPQYVVLVMIDEPKGDKSTFEFATGGWISAPVVKNIIARMGPLLGIKPNYDVPGDDAEKFWVDNSPAGSKPNEKPKPHPTAIPAFYQRFFHVASY